MSTSTLPSTSPPTNGDDNSPRELMNDGRNSDTPMTIMDHASTAATARTSLPGTSKPSYWASTVQQYLPLAGIATRQFAPPIARDDPQRPLQIMTEADVKDKLATAWPWQKKWMTLTVLAVVQISMNFNSSVYGNAVPKLETDFGISESQALMGQWVMLITYAFGCELWAPWSEDLGRKNVLQASLWAVNAFQIMCALAKNNGIMTAGRALLGLSSAGGSVTLGVIADMYGVDKQQHPIAFVVYASVMGSVVGPVFGAFIQRYISGWQWVFWIQCLLGVFTAVLHFVCCQETRSSVILAREARHRRGRNSNVATQDEVDGKGLTFKEISSIWIRPFKMFLREPIVLCLSLLSGFSDALIFLFLEAYGYVYSLWNFGIIAMGLTFIPLVIGYTIAYAIHTWDITRQLSLVARSPNGKPKRGMEEKLRILMFLAPLEFIGLLGFAWCSLGPAARVHWIAPMIFSVLVGIANYSIYEATIDYMVEAYGPYSSSATGGNGFARDFLAGISALYARPLFHNVGNRKKGGYPLVYGSLILACLCILVVVPVFIFFFTGPWIRSKSYFSKKVMAEREKLEQAMAAAAIETNELQVLEQISERSKSASTVSRGNDQGN